MDTPAQRKRVSGFLTRLPDHARVLAGGLAVSRDKPILNAVTLEEEKLEEILRQLREEGDVAELLSPIRVRRFHLFSTTMSFSGTRLILFGGAPRTHG